MGKVFTWEEVRNGHIPLLQDFDSAIKAFREAVMAERSILGALVCGSVTRGDHTVRSDVDCFVLYDHVRESEAFAFMQVSTGVAQKLHVPLGCVPCDSLLIKTRMHHLGQSFLWHLEKSSQAGGLLKGDPLKAVAESVSEQEELEAYLRVKMYNLQEAWSKANTFSDERTASYLQKLLEAPMHTARKTLAHLDRLAGDSKVQIRRLYRERMPSAMADQLERLVELDAYYTRGLYEQLERPQEHAYYRLLGSVLVRSEDVLEFIRSNLLFLAERAR